MSISTLSTFHCVSPDQNRRHSSCPFLYLHPRVNYLWHKTFLHSSEKWLLPANEVAATYCFQSCVSIFSTEIPVQGPFPHRILAPSPPLYRDPLGHVQTCSLWSSDSRQAGGWHSTEIVSRNAQYKDIYSRTIEILQRVHIVKAICCLKLPSPISE